MPKSATHVARVEGNVVFLKEAELKHSARDPIMETTDSDKAKRSGTDHPAAAPINDFAKAARLADGKGDIAMRDSICSKGIVHYTKMMRSISEEVRTDPSTYKRGMLKTASLLLGISELYGIWGYMESSYSYLNLSKNMEELVSELR